jgi:hypothetical protein
MFFEKRTTSIDSEGNRYIVTDEDYVLLDSVKIFMPENSFIQDLVEEIEEVYPRIIIITDRFNLVVVNIVTDWNNELTEKYYRKALLPAIYRDILPIHTIYRYNDDNIYVTFDGGDGTLNQAGVSFLTDVYIPNRHITMMIIGDEYDFDDIKDYVAKIIYNTGSSEFRIDDEKLWQLKN